MFRGSFMSIEVSTESDPQSSDEDTVPPLYEVVIADPYARRHEKATFTLLEHAVKMAIACTALGALPDHPEYRPVVGVSSNQFKEDFGIYRHGEGFSVDISNNEPGGFDEMDQYGNYPSLLSDKAYVFYSTVLEFIQDC